MDRKGGYGTMVAHDDESPARAFYGSGHRLEETRVAATNDEPGCRQETPLSPIDSGLTSGGVIVHVYGNSTQLQNQSQALRWEMPVREAVPLHRSIRAKPVGGGSIPSDL